MKKLFAVLLVAVMVLSLSACSGGDFVSSNPTEEVNVDNTEATVVEAGEDEVSDITEATEEEPQKETEETEVIEATNEETEVTEEATNEETEATEVTEVTEVTEEVFVVDPEVIDISNALESTSIESPAKLGEWMKSTAYSVESKQYETIYWRVIKTTFDCQEDIDRYNSENHIYEFTPLENEDLAYCKVVYQVYYPEDFPAREWGISSADISIHAKNPNGGGIEWKGVAYIGLGQCRDITKELDEKIKPGDVFTGESLYVMINDPSVNYIFEYYHNAEGEDGEMIYDYAVYK